MQSEEGPCGSNGNAEKTTHPGRVISALTEREPRSNLANFVVFHCVAQAAKQVPVAARCRNSHHVELQRLLGIVGALSLG